MTTVKPDTNHKSRAASAAVQLGTVNLDARTLLEAPPKHGSAENAPVEAFLRLFGSVDSHANFVLANASPLGGKSHMKNTRCLATLIGISALLAVTASAGSVSSTEATQAAANFLKIEQGRQQQPGAKALAVSIATVGEAHAITDAAGSALAHVVDLNPSGFIIVSADTSVEPILGYSFSGEFPFEDSRHNVLLHLVQGDMLERRHILDTGGEDAKRLAAIGASKWQALKTYHPTAEGPTPQGPTPQACTVYPSDTRGWITNVTWHQNCPYNKFCPYALPGTTAGCSPDRAAVGCVATAMAQILNYWKYPTAIIFTANDNYTTETRHIGIDADAATYGFPSFATINTALATINYTGADDEKAYLSFAAGIKLQMDYAADQQLQSSSYTRKVGPALLNGLVLGNGLGFGSAHVAYRQGDSVWTLYRASAIRNLMKGWPIQVGIRGVNSQGRSGGHSVVLEGYDECHDTFLINLGWGPLSDAWYSLPLFAAGGYNWNLVHTIVCDIAPYTGWGQVGADEQNSFRSPFDGPSSTLSKWDVTEPSGPALVDCVVGTGNQIYVALSDNQSSRHYSYILVIDQYGTVKDRIDIPDRSYDLGPPAQTRSGQIFVGGSYSWDSVHDNYLYRIDPKARSVTRVLTRPAGDGMAAHAAKVDDEDWVYARTNQKLFCLDATGTLKWTFTMPHNAASYFDEACSIDRARQNVYLPYYDSSTQTSYLGCVNRLTGALRFEKAFTSIPTESRMTGPASIGADGTVYVGTRTTLYALNPDASFAVKWSVDPSSGYGFVNVAPAIGRDGTLYTAYWIQVAGVDKVAFAAFNPANGSKNWEKPLAPSSTYDNPYRGYATQDGKVYFFSRDTHTAHRLRMVAYQDTGADATELFNQNYAQNSGVIGFGPGLTMYLAEGNTVHALAGGTPGDPDEAGMGFLNNRPPSVVTNLTPPNAALNLPTTVILTWQSSDPDGQALKYDVFLGDPSAGDGDIPPYVTQITNTTLTVTNLRLGATYKWEVVATDGQASTDGPVWMFTTTSPPQLAALRQGGNIVLSWSTNAAGFNLVSVTNLSSTNWTSVSPPTTVANGQNFVTNTITGNAKFYRLKK